MGGIGSATFCGIFPEYLSFPDLTQGKAVINEEKLYEVIYNKEIYEAIYDEEIYEAIYVQLEFMTTTLLWRKAKINGEMYVFLYYFLSY